MRKKVLILGVYYSLFVGCFLLFAAPVMSASATPAATSSQSAQPVDQKAQDLLNRVADKVKELSKNERHTYAGTVKSKGTVSLVITTSDGDHTVTTNDVTTFYRIKSGNRSDATFSSLKVGDDVAAVGTIDPQTGEMTATQVIAKIKRTNIVGMIEEINKTVLTIKDQTGGSVQVDLADAITLEKASTSNTVSKATAKDFLVGQMTFVIGYSPDPKTGAYSILKALTLTP